MSEERHPIRSLIKLSIFIGVLVAIGRFLSTKKQEYSGLTESEARIRMETKLASAVGEEKATEIVDQVIPALRGMFKSEVG